MRCYPPEISHSEQIQPLNRSEEVSLDGLREEGGRRRWTRSVGVACELRRGVSEHAMLSLIEWGTYGCRQSIAERIEDQRRGASIAKGHQRPKVLEALTLSESAMGLLKLCKFLERSELE